MENRRCGPRCDGAICDVIALLASAEDQTVHELMAHLGKIVEQVQRTMGHFVKVLTPQVVERIFEQMRQLILHKRVPQRVKKHDRTHVLPILEKEVMEEIDEVVQTISQEPVRNPTEEPIVDVLRLHCQEENVKALQFIPLELVQNFTKKQIVGVPVRQFQEVEIRKIRQFVPSWPK